MRQEFNELINPSQKGAFSAEIGYLTRRYQEFLADKELMLRMFDDGKALAKAMYGFAIGYLRHLRAFHFDDGKINLSERYKEFLCLLIDDRFISPKKLRSIEHAYEIALDHL